MVDVKQRIEEIAGRVRKATEGPWRVVDDFNTFQIEGPTETDGFRGGYRWFSP